MLLRPENATWFELLTGREDLAEVLRCLAASGDVELQSHSDLSAAHLLPRLRTAVDEYRRLAQRYASYWPPAATPSGERRGEPEQIATAGLAQLRAWAVTADPLIAELNRLAHEGSDLERLQPLLAQPDTALPDLNLFGRPGPILATRVYLLAPRAGVLGIPPAVLVLRIESSGSIFLLAVGPRSQIEALDETLTALEARRLELPDSLPADPKAALTTVRSRAREIDERTRQVRSQLAQADTAHGVSAALADLIFIEWLIGHVPEFAGTEHFVWITGWTSDPAGARLEAPLLRAHVHYLLHFPQPPGALSPPIVLHNPRWAQPFEMFSRLLGVPAANEADPSVILALVTPLMFGFMFGDVGQGAVLTLAGAFLRRKYPQTALLIPGGMAAMVFGVLFGSVFAREDTVPALWLHPMQQPLTLLGVSLAAGSVIILLGLLLDAVQHAWEGQGRRWWATRAGILSCYLGMIAGALNRRALWAIPAGLAWYCIGEAAQPPMDWRRLGRSLGEALETLLQLFVNTLSFVRVGAFALAHAGLAAAIVALCAGIGNRPVAWIALALGNVLLIAIEGLVVGIQTTRLVLFEFFIRFLHGSGRPFRPLQKPPTTEPLEPSRNLP